VPLDGVLPWRRLIKNDKFIEKVGNLDISNLIESQRVKLGSILPKF
jgi:hypothetical protein